MSVTVLSRMDAVTSSRWLARLLSRLPWAVLRLVRAGSDRAVGGTAVWAVWERLILRVHRVQPARPGGLFLFRVQRHRGAVTTFRDGTSVRRGDRIVELHINNRRLLAMRQERCYDSWRAVETLRADLEALACRVTAGELGPVVAIHGVSLLGAAAGRLGFEVHELRHSLRLAVARYFMAGMDAVYHPAGLRRLDSRMRDRWPVEAWMSARQAAEVARRQGRRPPAGRSAAPG